MIISCPDVATTFHLTWDTTKKKIAYTSIPQSRITTPVLTADDESKLSDEQKFPDEPQSNPNINMEITQHENTNQPKFSRDHPNDINNLLLDIEEEDTPQHTNCFLHYFLDKYNAKMGDLGNYIRTTTETFNHRFTEAENAFISTVSEKLHVAETQFLNITEKLKKSKKLHLKTYQKNYMSQKLNSKTLWKKLEKFEETTYKKLIHY
jgi:hypothetical protein